MVEKYLLRLLNFFLRLVLFFLILPLLYLFISLILTYIPVNTPAKDVSWEKSIFIFTNGVHLDIAVPVSELASAFLSDLGVSDDHRYLSFGWGDENFYINVPTWDKLTFDVAFSALFLDSPTLMHVTRYERKKASWVEVEVSEEQLLLLIKYIGNGFRYDENNRKIRRKDAGYSHRDDFYEAVGNYTMFTTCNTWANSGLRKSGIKASLWTPFDFGLLELHRD